MLFSQSHCQALGQEEAGNRRQATERTSCSSCRRPAPASRPRSGSSSRDSPKRIHSLQVLDMLLSEQLSAAKLLTNCYCGNLNQVAVHHALVPCSGVSRMRVAPVALTVLRSMAWSMSNLCPTSAWLGNCWACANESAWRSWTSYGLISEQLQAYPEQTQLSCELLWSLVSPSLNITVYHLLCR